MREFDRLARAEVLATGINGGGAAPGGRADAQVPVESENAPPTTTRSRARFTAPGACDRGETALTLASCLGRMAALSPLSNFEVSRFYP